MRFPDWTTFRSGDGTDPCGPCCLLEKSFDLKNLPRNYIWTLGYVGSWPDHPEAAEISAQVKSYSKQWLMERSAVAQKKAEEQLRQREEMARLKMIREKENQVINETEFTDVAAAKKRRIEASRFDMAKGLVKSAVDLATGGTTDPKERMEICNKCPFKSEQGRCNKCGCVLAAKTRIAKSSCPIGLW